MDGEEPDLSEEEKEFAKVDPYECAMVDPYQLADVGEDGPGVDEATGAEEAAEAEPSSEVGVTDFPPEPPSGAVSSPARGWTADIQHLLESAEEAAVAEGCPPVHAAAAAPVAGQRAGAVEATAPLTAAA